MPASCRLKLTFHLNDYVAYRAGFIRYIGPGACDLGLPATVPVLVAVSLLASAGEFTPRSLTMMGVRSTRANHPPPSTTWP